jgi:MFS family permease
MSEERLGRRLAAGLRSLAISPAFALLWAGQTVSVLGNGLSTFVIPTIAILSLRASTLQVALLTAIPWVAVAALGLPAGVWLDRWPRREVMIAANVGRAVILAGLAAATFSHLLSIAMLAAALALTGVLSVFFDVGYQSFLPDVVGTGPLVAANSRLEASQSGSRILGPALGGLILQSVGPAFALLGDAVSFVWSAATLVLLRARSERVPVPGTTFRVQLVDGLTALARAPILARLAIVTALLNLGGSLARSMFTVLAYRDLHVAPAALGVALGVAGAGFLVGVAAAAPLTRAVGRGGTVVVAAACYGVAWPIALLAFLGDPVPILALSQFIANAQLPIFNITQLSLRQQMTPNELRGRVNASFRVITWSAIPVGSVLGGLLASLAGAGFAVSTGGIIAVLAVAVLGRSLFREMNLVAPVERAAPLSRR